MYKSDKKYGFTLVELLVAMGIILVVSSASLFSIKALMDTYESSGQTVTLINSALSNARAIAVREGKYAGVRFQREYSKDGFDKASKYMIFIIEGTKKEMGNDADCFKAVEGRRPIRLPNSIGVMDTRYFDNGSDEDIA